MVRIVKRRRPRVESVSFHGLWWLVRREAFLRVRALGRLELRPFSSLRHQVLAGRHPFACLECGLRAWRAHEQAIRAQRYPA